MNPKNIKVKIPFRERIVILIIIVIAIILTIKTISYYNEKDPSYGGYGNDNYEYNYGYSEETTSDITSMPDDESDVYYDDLDN